MCNKNNEKQIKPTEYTYILRMTLRANAADELIRLLLHSQKN